MPHCLPFREMAALPAIVQRLNWIQGPGFKLNTLGFTIVSEQGCGGQSLHANGVPLWGTVNAFQLHDGRFHAGSVSARPRDPGPRVLIRGPDGPVYYGISPLL